MPASTGDWDPLFEPPAAERAQRDAVRALRMAMVGIALVVVAGVLALVARSLDDDGDDGAGPLAGEPAEPAVPTTGGIGPSPGQAIADYAGQREAELASLGESDRRVAVVTFTRYRNEAEAQVALDDVVGPGAVDVLARLVAVGGDVPHVVTGSLSEWTGTYKATAVIERVEIEKLVPSVEPDSDWAMFYADELARLDAVIAGADPAAPLIYAVAVFGPVRVLRALADASTVRLVDVGPSDEPPDGDVYRAPLPDEVTTTGDPQHRPVPVR